MPRKVALFLLSVIMLLAPSWADAPPQLSVLRGKVEVRAADGRWQALSGPQAVAIGTTVRTAPNAAALVTFANGSTIDIASGSAVRFKSISPVEVQVIGHVTTTLTDTSMQVAANIPIGRCTFGGSPQGQDGALAFAPTEMADAPGVPVARRFELVTPTARDAEVAVHEGTASIQTAYNVTGHVATIDDRGFTLRGDKPIHVVVGARTLLAAATLKAARETRGPAILPRLSADEKLIVYGIPGPDGVEATVIYPEDGRVLDGEAWLDTESPPPTGNAVTASTGHTLKLTAGSLAALLVSGAAVSTLAATQVATATSAGIAGVTVVAAAAVTAATVAVANNGKGIQTPPQQGGGTRNINLVLHRPVLRMAPQTAAVTPPLGSLAVSSTWTPGASIGTTSAGSLFGQFPMGPRWRFHVAASATGGVVLSGFQSDAGLDYRLSKRSAVGVGWQHQTYTLIDAFGNVRDTGVDGPEIRYTVHW